MVKGFERESRLRVPRGQMRDVVAKATGTNAKALALVRPDGAEAAPPPADAAALVAAWDAFPAISYAESESARGRGGDDDADAAVPKRTRTHASASDKNARAKATPTTAPGASPDVVVVMHGHVSNASEIRELYELEPAAPPLPATPVSGKTSDPPAATRRSTRASARAEKLARDAIAMPPPPPREDDRQAHQNAFGLEGARLILDLYERRFEDKDGDPSDQPTTALTACEGSFSFVLVDQRRGAVLAARSAESDTHPLFWGTAPRNPGEDASDPEGAWDGSMLLSSDLAALDGPCGGAAVAFPLAAFYYVDDSLDYGVIQRLNPSGAKRKVRPMHRINSSGKVCGLGFYTESGHDLASMAHKYIA